MLEELKNKTFANEAEEAEWWESNEDALLEDFERASADGRLGLGTVVAHSRAGRASEANGDKAALELDIDEQ